MSITSGGTRTVSTWYAWTARSASILGSRSLLVRVPTCLPEVYDIPLPLDPLFVVFRKYILLPMRVLLFPELDLELLNHR